MRVKTLSLLPMTLSNVHIDEGQPTPSFQCILLPISLNEKAYFMPLNVKVM